MVSYQTFFDNFMSDFFYFNEEEIRNDVNEADWFAISRHLHELPLDFIREFRDNIQWERVNYKKFRKRGYLNEFNRSAEDRINKFNSIVYENEPPFSFILKSCPQEDNETIIII